MMDQLDDDFLNLLTKKCAAARAQHRSPRLCDQLLARVEEMEGRVEGVVE